MRWRPSVAFVAVLVLGIGTGGLVAPAAARTHGADARTMTVTPSTDLVDGQTVTVEGDGWSPDSRPRLEQCEVGTFRCVLQTVRLRPDSSGHFAVERPARAYFMSEEGEVDCLVSACEFHIDFNGVFRVPISFDPDGPLLPRPTITVATDHPLVDGEEFVVLGANFSPGDGIYFAECTPGATFIFDDECHELGNGSSLPQAWNGNRGAPPPEYAMRHVGADGSFRDRLWAYANAYTYPARTDCRVVACDLVASVWGHVVARTPLSFDPTAPLRGPPTIRANPTSGLVHHWQVTVRGADFYGREPVVLQQCIVAVASCHGWNFEHPDVDAAGGFVHRIRVNRTVRLSSGERVDCRTVRCTVRISRFTYAGRPQQIELPITFAR